MLVHIPPYSSFMNCLISLLQHRWHPNPMLNTWAFAQLVVPDCMLSWEGVTHYYSVSAFMSWFKTWVRFKQTNIYIYICSWNRIDPDVNSGLPLSVKP